MNKKIEEVFDLLNVFNKKYNIYNCQIENSTFYYNTMISCISELILCKSVFKKNKDLVEFLSKIFGFSFPEYVTKNKTLILGRTIRYFSELEDIEEIKNALNKLYEVISKIVNDGYDKTQLTWQEVIDSIDLSR